ncbi:MAG: hypothetical protein ABIT76_13625 [Chthoniobacterales bacterium]
MKNLFLAIACLTVVSAHAQTARFTVAKAAHAGTGELVVAVQIYAVGNQLALHGVAPKPTSEDPDPLAPAFSLAGAWLQDAATGKKIQALSTVPRKPYFGPLDVVTVLSKGDSIQMGVAFPFPPAADGSKWLLYLPLDAKPVPVELPLQ